MIDRLSLLPLLAANLLGLTLISSAIAASTDAEAEVAVISPDESALEHYIKRKCTFCHSQYLTGVLLNRMMATKNPSEMDVFLAGHHIPDPTERDAVLRYLEQHSK